MFKKIFITFAMLVLFVSTNAYAGSIPEEIMSGDQKAIFIGKITNITKETYSISPSTIMMGNIQESEIQIERFDRYYGTNNKPKVGDFIVAVLLDDNKIDDTWVFKSTSDDYKTLKLISKDFDMVLRYEEYINEGKYFDEENKIKEDTKVSIPSANISSDITDKANINKEQTYLINKQFILLLTVIILGLIYFCIVRYKKKHIK